MAVNFRCDSCGKLLSFEDRPPAEVECPQCNATVTVPEALASLPQPRVAPNAKRPTAPSPAPAGQNEEEAWAEEEQDSQAMAAVASVMPIVMSVLFHVGLFVIFLFITFFVQQVAEDKVGKKNTVVVQAEDFSEDAGGVKFQGKADPTQQNQQEMPTESKKWANQQDTVAETGVATTQAVLMAPSVGGVSGDLAAQGLAPGGQMGPPGEMFGMGSNAHHRVFVIDASGSMIGKLSDVKFEMLRQIAKLHPSQTFHIVFFNDDLKDENPPRRLVDVTQQTQIEAAEFLDKVRADSEGGTTNPLPAMRRAFQVLAQADPKKPGKQIFLLTDGDFDVPREELLAKIKQMKGNQNVAIFTFLYNFRSLRPDDPNSVESVLQAISDLSNNGKFKYVEGR